MTTLDLNLVSVIKNAGGDAGDMTDAVWKAGYRKTNFTTEQIIDITASMVIECCYMELPHDTLPKTLGDISQYHLNCIIIEYYWDNSPAVIARAIMENGYRKGGDK